MQQQAINFILLRHNSVHYPVSLKSYCPNTLSSTADAPHCKAVILASSPNATHARSTTFCCYAHKKRDGAASRRAAR